MPPLKFKINRMIAIKASRLILPSLSKKVPKKVKGLHDETLLHKVQGNC